MQDKRKKETKVIDRKGKKVKVERLEGTSDWVIAEVQDADK